MKQTFGMLWAEIIPIEPDAVSTDEKNVTNEYYNEAGQNSSNIPVLE
ncbi:hypothetical protein ACVRWL_07975 [Streptococcus ratti]|uniref:Uncharacterized protein n=1 Tax=Streptococcus ratti TaxID=1341 RepID=A0A7X9LEK2_STRRT|nr:hypothetical protein [Streptococcus ratti]NMD49549.1 hypothetical protein [Streptococcus ratti]